MSLLRKPHDSNKDAHIVHRCPATHKVKLNAAIAMKRIEKYSSINGQARHGYKCDHRGAWHISHRPLEKYGIVEKLEAEIDSA